MTLNQLEKDDKAKIIAINCDDVLRNRFYSFGIIKGESLSVEELTLAKSTMEIKINQTEVALRLSEAEKIEVEYEK